MAMMKTSFKRSSLRNCLAIQAGKPDIEQQDVGPAGQGGMAIVDGLDIEADEFEQERQAESQVLVLIGDEDESPPEEVHGRTYEPSSP
jgi:hypothetical protein